MSVTAAAGFEAAGVVAGLRTGDGPDVALVLNRGPSAAAAAVCSASRRPAIRSRGVSSKPPCSPRVQSSRVTSIPLAHQPAIVPAAPKSASSGWAVTTKARSTSASGSGSAQPKGLGGCGWGWVTATAY